MVLRQTNRSLGQNQESGNRPTPIWITDFWQIGKGNSLEEEQSF